ncbi:MAG: ribosomal protein S18-alanine N-acetyltransferase [Anaerolineae bacterium]
MNLVIRKMTLADVPVVHEIDLLSFTLPWPEHSFRFEVTDNPAARCWVAEMDGRVVAALVIWLIVDEAHVATLATHPDFRRQGIARRLLAHALGEARREGARRAFLEVRASNQAAQDLYRSLGFVEDGRRPKYYKDNGEDAILMSHPDLGALIE